MMKRLLISILVLICTAPLAIPTTAHTDGQGAMYACQRAVAKEVRRSHPHAVRVEFVDGKVRKVSKGERGVKGNGLFQVKKGKSYKFTYRCTYNSRSGKTYGVSVHKK
jgi:hypothetical protein